MPYIDVIGANKVIHDTAVPTVGQWDVGDEWRNTEPAAGESLRGVCVTAGTPGTWKVEAPLSQGAVADIQHAVVTVTNAQIKALRASPKTLVAAPGSGKVLQLIDAALYLDYGSNVLTESTDNLAIKYTDGSGAAASDTIEATNFIDAAADTVISAVPVKDVIMVANAALVLHNTGDGEYAGNAGADTTMKVFVTYKVITLA